MPRPVFTFGAKGPKVTQLSNEDSKAAEASLGHTSDLLGSLVPIVDMQAKGLRVSKEGRSKPIKGEKLERVDKAVPAPELKPIAPFIALPDVSKFGPLETYAKGILASEKFNTYEHQENRIFPIQTRLSFQTKINEMYVSPDFMKRGQETELDFDACKKLTSGEQSKVEMYEYQKFVRDYLKNAAPYRGLLVYHGLGSGKTCSAIADA
jgi:hypothetical protein